MLNFFKRKPQAEPPPAVEEVVNSSAAEPAAPLADAQESAPQVQPAADQPAAAETPPPGAPPLIPQPPEEIEKSIPPLEPPPSRPVVPPVKPERKSGGMLYWLFSPQTRAGRVLRPLLRWLAAVTGLFALGLLAGYLLLYQPTQKQLDQTVTRLAQATQAVSQKDTALLSSQTDREQALKALQTAQASLKQLSSENDLLVVLAGIQSARVALVNKDGQTAKSLLDQAQTDLAKAQPYLESQDKNRAELLPMRLSLAIKELASDPSAAQADLEKFITDLNDLRARLFKK